MPSGKQPTNKSKLIRELIRKFPGYTKTDLARIAIEKYPLVFDDVENTRAVVRYVTDTIGEPNRARNKQVEQYLLPESRAKERQFYRIERKNILWLSDIHIPNQNNKAIELAVNYGIEKKVDCILLGGDIMDNTPFTSHDAPLHHQMMFGISLK